MPSLKTSAKVVQVALGLAVFALSVILIGVSFPQTPLTPVVPDDLNAVSLIGEYRVDGGEWIPLDGAPEVDISDIHTLVARGHLSQEVPAGEKLNFRLSNTFCIVSVNGEEVFNQTQGAASFMYSPGNVWANFVSPGISTDDVFEVELTNAYRNGAANTFSATFTSLCVGDTDAVLAHAVASQGIVIAMGLLAIISGLILMFTALIGRMVRLPGEPGSLMFAFYAVSAGVWCLFDYGYISLVIPHPAFINIVGTLMEALMPLFFVAFIVPHTTGKIRKFMQVLVAFYLATAVVQLALQLAGVIDMYEVNTIGLSWGVAVFFGMAVLLVYEWLYKHNLQMRSVVIVAIPCIAGIVVEILQYLSGVLVLGIWVETGIFLSILARFPAVVSRMKTQADAVQRLNELEAKLMESKIAIMMSQIQPHFLYNALNTIQYLCSVDPQLAAKTIEDFSKYLRGNMDSLTQTAPIPLAKEMEHVENYLAIERLRFPDMRIEYDLQTLDFLVPSLTVQPLVENAIRHGIRKRMDGGTIVISSWSDETADYVRVSDDGVGFAPEAATGAENAGQGNTDAENAGRHIGLANVESRIASLCSGSMQVESSPGRGTKVTLVIPRGTAGKANPEGLAGEAGSKNSVQKRKPESPIGNKIREDSAGKAKGSGEI